MKENKEETQLRSAEEILAQFLKPEVRGFYDEEIITAMNVYASQFKPSGVKTFALEDFIHKWVGILERLYPMDAGTQSQLINELRNLKYD